MAVYLESRTECTFGEREASKEWSCLLAKTARDKWY